DLIRHDVTRLEQGARLPRRAVHRRGSGAQRRGDVRAREAGEPGEEHVEPRAGLRRIDDVRQRRASRRSEEMISSATPIVIAESATLNTFGQIVLKSTTQRCWKRSTMFPIAPPTIIPNATRTRFERRTASRNAYVKIAKTISASTISSAGELPKSPNAPCVFCTYVHQR